MDRGVSWATVHGGQKESGITLIGWEISMLSKASREMVLTFIQSGHTDQFQINFKRISPIRTLLSSFLQFKIIWWIQAFGGKLLIFVRHTHIYVHTCTHTHTHIYIYICILLYILASLVTQKVMNPPPMQETWVQSLGWQDPLEKGTATHSSILAWRIPMDRGASWATVHGGQKESDSTEWLSTLYM